MKLANLRRLLTMLKLSADTEISVTYSPLYKGELIIHCKNDKDRTRILRRLDKLGILYGITTCKCPIISYNFQEVLGTAENSSDVIPT